MRLSAEQRQLAQANLTLVHKVIKDKVRGVGIGIFTYGDLYQIGCIGLCKAACTDKFQYARDGAKAHTDTNAHDGENAHAEAKARFSTYAYRIIWNEICRQLEYSTKLAAETPIEPGSAEKRIAVDDGIYNSDFHFTLERIIDEAQVGASETITKGIQALRYVAEGYTSTEIAAMMGGGSCHNVTAWISKARKHLKKNPELIRLMYSA